MLMQTHEARLSGLRRELEKRKLDGFIIPISDEHMSEYVGSYAQRLGWLTGFGGSAGSAVVLKHKAAIFVDGRYTVQVRQQVDEKLFEYCSVPRESIGQWSAKNAKKGAKIGYDPWLHTETWVDHISSELVNVDATLVAVQDNPIDAIWKDRPAPSVTVAKTHSENFAGGSSAKKRSDIADWLKTSGYDLAVISALDSIAWLLNIRGDDVEHTPVALSYALVHSDATAELFIAPEKVTPDLLLHLGNAVTVRDRSEFPEALRGVGNKRAALDPSYGVAAISQILRGGGTTVKLERDPTILPRAIKNIVEQEGHRRAQARDGVAVCQFLRWIEERAPSGEITEMAAASKLLEYRKQLGCLVDISFDTISAAGEHAALPHYKVDGESNIKIPTNSIFLCDSGGQYLEGTTDITRTVWVGPGQPTAEMKDRFTRVLKGHIQIDCAVFPQGTTGGQLDSFARKYLWEAGVDYAHGTGHGVGSFLSVHEGPQRIAKPGGGQPGTNEELFAGMILSNEPGYYKQGKYGIRIENLVLTIEKKISGAEGDFLGFECLTFVPIDRSLVDKSLMTPSEISWWEEYHSKVWNILSPQLIGDDLLWLKKHCLPL